MLYFHLRFIVVVVAAPHQEHLLVDELFELPFLLDVLESEQFFAPVIRIIIIRPQTPLLVVIVFRQALFEGFKLAGGANYGTVSVLLFPNDAFILISWTHKYWSGDVLCVYTFERDVGLNTLSDAFDGSFAIVSSYTLRCEGIYSFLPIVRRQWLH